MYNLISSCLLVETSHWIGIGSALATSSWLGLATIFFFIQSVTLSMTYVTNNHTVIRHQKNLDNELRAINHEVRRPTACCFPIHHRHLQRVRIQHCKEPFSPKATYHVKQQQSSEALSNSDQKNERIKKSLVK